MNVTQLKTNTIDPTGARSFPGIALETKLLIDLLKGKVEGDTVSYADLELCIGRPCTPNTQGYSYLQSARRILLRDYNMVLDSEPKIGVRVCTNDEKMIVSGRDLKRARRATQRSRQKLRSVEYERLDEPKKKEWNSRMSLVGALDLMTTDRAVKKVEHLISDHPLPSAKTLELFQK